MMNRSHAELGPLQAYVEAVREDVPDAAESQAALLDKLQRAPAREAKSRLLGWRQLSWAAPALLVVTVALVLFAGGPAGPRPAFAAVQRYFMDFETLYVESRMTVMGQPVMEMEIYLERGGRTRVDMADGVTHVVDPGAGEMVTFLHDSRTAQRTALPVGSSGTREELDWLYRIRDFQGQARLLPEQRVVHGVPANGFELVQDDLEILVWAAAEDDRPLRMEMAMGGPRAGLMEMQLDFRFNEPLEATLFDLAPPPDYRWLDSAEVK